jgi:CRP-like cAMP-binding protein
MVRELLASRYNLSRLSREAASARFSSYTQESALKYPEISKSTTDPIKLAYLVNRTFRVKLSIKRGIQRICVV